MDDFNTAPAAVGETGGPAAEIASITDSMFLPSGERNPAYWRNEQAQARLTELLGAKQGNSARASSAGRSPNTAPTPDTGERRDAEPSEHAEALGDFAGDPAFEGMAEVLQSIEAPPELLSAIVDGFADTTDHSARDASDLAETEAAVRAVWGDQYQQNIDAIRAYLTHSLPAGVGNLIMNARINGRALLNNPEVAFYLQDVATRMPAIPSTGDDARDIAAIENLIGTEPQRYRRDLGLQARLRSLYAKRERRGR